MVSRSSEGNEGPPPSSRTPGTPAKARVAKLGSSPSKRDEKSGEGRVVKSSAKDVAELKDYQLGDCLGRGAFGSVYRALNWNTGETVAVKQIKLADLPKSELRVIMLEIDLLKNLDHPNIVKYHGFVKSAETLNIILEYCENGSLHSISKNFGRFPENLVGLYMSQVLHGLLYLHEQGVIHRDIKGANILTTKEGLVKLADFGVASRTTGLSESSVVGTPYWMAPEVIELSGATTASDIWSLGCTVIELLEGKPPYYNLQPMPALFRIVNDDHPPLPQGASPAVKDFLMQCFQKDPNLRVSARKLLKHPWIVNARRSDSVVPKKSTEYEEAVRSVQEWNEALRSPGAGTLRKPFRHDHQTPSPLRRNQPPSRNTPTKDALPAPVVSNAKDQSLLSNATAEDNWDDDFATAISPSALQLPHLRPHDNFGGMLSSEKLKAFASLDGTVVKSEDSFEDFNDSFRTTLHCGESDPLQTIRPFPFRQTGADDGFAQNSPLQMESKRSTPFVHNVPNLTQNPVPPSRQSRPASFYKENSVEDYSDLIITDEDVLGRKLNIVKVSMEANIDPNVDDCLSDQFQETDEDQYPSNFADLPPSKEIVRYQTPSQDDEQEPQLRRQLSTKRHRSAVEIHRFAENERDEDFSDILGAEEVALDKPDSDGSSDRSTLMLNSRHSNNSWLGDQDDEDDPFAQLEEGLDEMDLEANIARDKYARLRGQVEGLVSSLKTSQDEDVLEDISEQLLTIFCDLPETKNIIMSAHGMLPILEILDTCRRRDVVSCLLKIVNAIIYEDYEIQENLCFVGGIPIINEFASKKYPREIRLEAAAFVQQMYQTSTLTLQMFVSAGGLNVLVEFLEDDYEDERDLVLIGVNGIWSVFELQGSTPKNDFCRILSRSSVLDPLSLVLSRVLDEGGELAEIVEGRIASIFFVFSQAENHVKEMVAERTVLHRVLKELKRMTPAHQITMLKFIKNLSMLSTTLDSLQNSNAIDVLTDLLRSTIKRPHFREVSNQILNTIYNMCRLNKSRQEDAALNGIVPLLQKIVKTERPLKEFALPILCDMAHSGKVGRRELWRNRGLPFYISLLSDPYWQVTALDAIFTWLQEETAKVEEHLLSYHPDQPSFTESIIRCLTVSKANAFENLLEPLQKLLRLSPPIALTFAREDMFVRIRQKLHHNKAAVRLNLLRIISSICEASEDQGGLLAEYGLLEAIRELEHDPAILVRDMAGKLIQANERSESYGLGKRRPGVRRGSTATTPPGLLTNQSAPSTPSMPRTSQSKSYFDGREVQRHPRNALSGSALALRPASRDGASPALAFTVLIVFGMRAALRNPLRASDFDPAALFRYNPNRFFLSQSSKRNHSSASSLRSPIFFQTPLRGTCQHHSHARPSFRTCPSSRYYSTKSPTLPEEVESRDNRSDHSSSQESRTRILKYAIIAGVAGAAAVTLSDDAQHIYRAAQRTGRVVGTLAVCINDYRVTLKQETPTEEERQESIRACHKRCAERTLRVLEKNGSIFIKLGQHLSSMGYLLPLEWTTTFVPLQDKCPVSSIESVEEMFVTDTGHRIDELFSSFEPLPIGAASLAQVHIGTLKETGQKVAVKVQHPALAEWVPLDLALTRFTFSMLKRFFPEYDLEWLSNEMDFSLPQELDFRMEAENARRASEYFKKHSDAPLVIPEVMWAQKRILVMEFLSGHRPDDLEYLDSNHIDRDEVSAAFAHIFNEMIFGDNAPLHCDPHGGNIAIRKNPNRRRHNFDIILYDHGLYRDIPRDLRRSYAKLWLAVIEADEGRMREYARKVAGITDEQFPLFASAITGRDYTVLAKKDVASPRTAAEKENISGALGEGMLQQLVELLGQVPRIILLILKTNDLTNIACSPPSARSLDENLHTRQGPVRTFLILARYATRTVFEEKMENINETGGILRPLNFLQFLWAWTGYLRVELKLSVYETLLSMKSRLGLIG
ncbi:cytokinesis protein sepH [Aspergillus lentulus]|uniref:Cytokinesis protein sepH n=1 Tax=Aspergillus lentulus TaxID=293939 RepID=A0AAN4PNZ1_ASPLE|nr:cytokinesis protein sepH [Aspergillus lentulus]